MIYKMCLSDKWCVEEISLPGEVWKPIPSLPQYLASSLGRVVCLPYDIEMPYGGLRRVGGVPNYGSSRGDRRAVMYKGKNYKVHRLVCEAFHGPPPFPRAVVMHKDENGHNNREDNLVWGTQKENLNAPGFLAYCRSRTGADNPYSKGLSKNKVNVT